MTASSALSHRLDYPSPAASRWRVAEFFAGIGLVRLALEPQGFEIAWANDIDSRKTRLYRARFGETDLMEGDIAAVSGRDIPTVNLATASFPCTDLSLAGNRAGLNGTRSGVFWEFVRILGEMAGRSPSVLLIENVTGFITSNDGRDLEAAIAALNDLGYWCDILTLDAKMFSPQSRPRMFLVASRTPMPAEDGWEPSLLRSRAACHFVARHPGLRMQPSQLPSPRGRRSSLEEIVQTGDEVASLWWDQGRVDAFVGSMSDRQRRRVEFLRASPRIAWRTAYRRTRNSKATWEARSDDIAGCLRTTRGGSSKQAIVEAGRGELRVRWMTGREYARLQGVPEDFPLEVVSENQALFALGDAVSVPVVAWIGREYLVRLLTEENVWEHDDAAS